MTAIVISVIGADPLQTEIKNLIRGALGGHVVKNLGASTMAVVQQGDDMVLLPTADAQADVVLVERSVTADDPLAPPPETMPTEERS